MLISVVLPAPLWPKIPINSFGSISRLKLLIAYTLFLEQSWEKVLDKSLILKPKAGNLPAELL